MITQVLFYTGYYGLNWFKRGIYWVVGIRTREEQMQDEINQLRQEIEFIKADRFVEVESPERHLEATVE